MKFIARHREKLIPLDVERSGDGYSVTIGERRLYAELTDANRFVSSLRMENGDQYLLVHHREGNKHEISFGDRAVNLELFDPLTLKRSIGSDQIGGSGPVKAVMPGRIVRLLVSRGDAVSKGDSLLILEAMKMENEITAPRDGVVASISVEEGQTVESGAELVDLD